MSKKQNKKKPFPTPALLTAAGTAVITNSAPDLNTIITAFYSFALSNLAPISSTAFLVIATLGMVGIATTATIQFRKSKEKGAQLHHWWKLDDSADDWRRHCHGDLRQ